MADSIQTGWDTTTDNDALRGGLRKVFDTTTASIDVMWPGMFNDISTDMYIERDMRMAGLGDAEAVAEGANVPIQDIPSPDTKDYTQEKFGTGFRITMEMKKFNRIGLMKKLTSSLSRVMKLQKDKQVHGLWNSPTATYTGYDSQVLGYALHTCKDAGATTYNNIQSAAISTTSIESALYYFKMMVDDQGEVIGATPDKIYFEPTLMFTVDELFGSKGMPWEQSNTKNPYTKWGLEQYPNIRLSATTAWGILAKKDPLFDVNVFSSQKPNFKTKDAPDTTDDTIVTSVSLYDFGFGDPRCVFIGNT